MTSCPLSAPRCQSVAKAGVKNTPEFGPGRPGSMTSGRYREQQRTDERAECHAHEPGAPFVYVASQLRNPPTDTLAD